MPLPVDAIVIYSIVLEAEAPPKNIPLVSLEHMVRSSDKNFVFYLTRHTCASRIIQATGSIPLVQQMLGHKTIDQSLRYAKLAPHNLRQALCALDNALELPDKNVTNMSEYTDNSVNKKEGEKTA